MQGKGDDLRAFRTGAGRTCEGLGQWAAACRDSLAASLQVASRRHANGCVIRDFLLSSGALEIFRTSRGIDR